MRTLVSLVLAASLAAVLPEARAAAPDTARVTLAPGAPATQAFVAFPSGDKPAPALIVVHEWWGLNAQIREIARRLARQGYVVIVPDLYGGRVAEGAEEAHVLSRSVEDEPAMVAISAAASWLRVQPRTARSRIGIIGFCMGGGLAQQFAMSTGTVSAAVVFYGTPEPAARIAQLRAPLQAHFGAADDGIPAERVQIFKAALEKAGRANEVHVYTGAGHAFMNEERPSFKPDAARLAWVRTLAFLQKHLKS